MIIKTREEFDIWFCQHTNKIGVTINMNEEYENYLRSKLTFLLGCQYEISIKETKNKGCIIEHPCTCKEPGISGCKAHNKINMEAGEIYKEMLKLKLDKYFSIGEYFIIKEYADGTFRMLNTDGSELTEEQLKKNKDGRM